MRKIKNPFFILFAMTVFTVSISAQAGSFDIYMNNIKTRLPEIRKNEVNLLQVKNEIYKTKSVDDTYFNINASYFNADDKQLSMDSFIDTTRSGLGTNFSVKKKFSATGTDLIFESSFYGQKYRRNGTNIFDNVYEPMFSMGFSQPLLYDRFGFLDKFIIQNAKEKYKLEKLKAEINNKELLTYYAKLYFDVLAYNEILNLIDKNIENGNVLYKQIKDKHKKGLVDGDDVEKVILLNSRLREKKIEIENFKNQILTQIKPYLTGIDMKDCKDCEDFLKKSTENKYSQTDFDKTALGKLLNLNILITKNILSAYKNRTLPELNIIGNIRLDTYSTSSVGDSFSEGKNPEFFIGLEFSKSLGNYGKRSELKEISLKVELSLNDYQIIREKYEQDLGKLLLNIKTCKKILSVKENNISSLEKRYSIEKKKFDTGRIPLSFLIDTENDIINEKIADILTKIKIIRVNFDYDLLTFSAMEKTDE